MTQGRLRTPGIFERALLWLLLLVLTLLLVHGDWLWRWNQLLYDAQLRFWSRPAPADVVIVAIDEASLAEFGRWPWSRRIHARLIERLTRAGASGVGLDIILAEPSSLDPAGDEALAAALHDNGRTVLPVLVEQVRLGGQLRETLPIPELAEAAAGLGHVHVELDPDGIARRMYLKEGLGAAHWPSFGLALLQVAQPGASAALPGLRNPGSARDSPHVWVRDFQMLIPFLGPPGRFQRISYSRVVSGQFPADALRDKLVLVGVTAAGLGDALPTPVSGYNQPMPGVEINANVVDALRRGVTIRPLAWGGQMLLSALLVLLPALLFAHLTPRWNLIVTALLLLFALGGSLALLQLVHLWFPPAAALLGLALSYPLWSWRRLEYTVRYLNRELAELHEEQARTPVLHRPDLAAAMRFLQQVLPVDAWVLLEHGNAPRDGDAALAGGAPAPDAQLAGWTVRGDMLWCGLDGDGKARRLGLRWCAQERPDTQQLALLDGLRARYGAAPASAPRGAVELIQARIQQVQQARDQLRALRHFIADTLSQMADGVLVVDTLGSVVLANRQAALYLLGDRQRQLRGRQVTPLLDNLEMHGTGDWSTVLREVLLQRRQMQVETQHRAGGDLLVQLAPLAGADRDFSGLIVNLADIGPLKDSERRRSELLGFLSHDLRSPLVSLLALLEIAKSRGPQPELTDLVIRMESYTNDTLELAEEFLQLAQAESGEDIHFSDTDLMNVALNAIEQVWAQAQQKNMRVVPELLLDEAWTRADANLIERALVNLLNNAIKYSPEGTKVCLRLTAAEEVYRCCVIDEGPGISEAALPRLFDRFYRVRSADQERLRGTGLGLTLVKVVAERHGGEVEVQSEPGAGSRFCLVLPRTSTAADH